MRDKEVEKELVEMFREEDGEQRLESFPGAYRHVSRAARFGVLSRQDWVCNMCGCKLKYGVRSSWDGEVAHIDHIVPFTKREGYDGDINGLSNLQALCPKCNLSKNKKEIQ